METPHLFLMSNKVSAYFRPMFAGRINGDIGRLYINGLCINPRNDCLVALYVIGSNNALKQLRVAIHRNRSFTIRYGLEWNKSHHSRTIYPRGKYRISKFIRFPNTPFLSMMVEHSTLRLTNSMLKSTNFKDMDFSFVPNFNDDEDLADRVFQRIEAITRAPIQRHWIPWMIKSSTYEFSNRGYQLCGYIRPSDKYIDPSYPSKIKEEYSNSWEWSQLASIGFNVFWLKHDYSKWENLIIRGLRSKEIQIKGV